MNDNGFILLARKITESEIFVFKPAVWLKLWIHLVSRVNWKDSSVFKRGSGFFKYEIAKGWFVDGELTPDIYKKAISFFKKSEMISTSRTPRGLKISILNYDLYQDIENYGSTTEAHQKHIRSTSITKEIKKERNIISISKKLPIPFKREMLSEAMIVKVMEELEVDRRFVDDKINAMESWSNKGNDQRDWYLTLRNWIRRDKASPKMIRSDNFVL